MSVTTTGGAGTREGFRHAVKSLPLTSDHNGDKKKKYLPAITVVSGFKRTVDVTAVTIMKQDHEHLHSFV